LLVSYLAFHQHLEPMVETAPFLLSPNDLLKDLVSFIFGVTEDLLELPEELSLEVKFVPVSHFLLDLPHRFQGLVLL